MTLKQKIWLWHIILLILGCVSYPKLYVDNIYIPKKLNAYEKKLDTFFNKKINVSDIIFMSVPKNTLEEVCEMPGLFGCAIENGYIFIEDEWKESCIAELHEMAHIAILQIEGTIDPEHKNKVFDEVDTLCAEIMAGK